MTVTSCHERGRKGLANARTLDSSPLAPILHHSYSTIRQNTTHSRSSPAQHSKPSEPTNLIPPPSPLLLTLDTYCRPRRLSLLAPPATTARTLVQHTPLSGTEPGRPRPPEDSHPNHSTSLRVSLHHSGRTQDARMSIGIDGETWNTPTVAVEGQGKARGSENEQRGKGSGLRSGES